MKKIDAHLLLEKYKLDTISDEELVMLESWYIDEIKSNKSYEGLEAHIHAMDKTFSFIPQPDSQRKNNNWKKIAVAASLLIAFSASYWLYRGTDLKTNDQVANDINPGKNSATLTLSNGKKIKLTDAMTGKLAEETGVKITKTTDEQILYEAEAAGNTKANGGLNTLSTSNGESYRIRLPDGSLVILNAASSLTYATNLNKLNVRSVTLNGEAYFEISKDEKHPFVVKTASQEVAVLGTHFNINSYKDEPLVKTTLIEGMVKVTPENRNQKSIILKPGEQAALSSGGTLLVTNVDTEEVLAWKNGYFLFNDEEIESILKKVARWYDVEIKYESTINKERFNGMISRSKSLNQVLKMLEKTDVVKFKTEGRRVIVRQ